MNFLEWILWLLFAEPSKYSPLVLVSLAGYRCSVVALLVQFGLLPTLEIQLLILLSSLYC